MNNQGKQINIETQLNVIYHPSNYIYSLCHIFLSWSDFIDDVVTAENPGLQNLSTTERQNAVQQEELHTNTEIDMIQNGILLFSLFIF